MGELSHNPLAFIVIGSLYVVGAGVYAWWAHRRGNALLEDVRRQGPPGLWEALGKPTSIRAAVRDPERRWLEFIRGGEYKNYGPWLKNRVETFRRDVIRGLFVLAALGVSVIYLFWPLVEKDWGL